MNPLLRQPSPPPRRFFQTVFGPIVAAMLAGGVLSALGAVPPFRALLVHDGFRVLVAEGLDEPESIGSYTITLTAPDGKTMAARQSRDGTIEDVWATDLIGDGGLEIVVATRSTGTGSYGALAIYRWTGRALESLPVTELSPAQRQGYRGRDLFSLDRGLVARTFPVYRSADPNANPSGGMRRLIYDFQHNRWVSDWR